MPREPFATLRPIIGVMVILLMFVGPRRLVVLVVLAAVVTAAAYVAFGTASIVHFLGEP
jgi:hypothetical protein